MQNHKFKGPTVAILVLLAFFAGGSSAYAVNTDHPAFAQASPKSTSIPIGHAEFCRSHASECGPNTTLVNAVQLTEQRWRELVEVNANVNATIVPVTDDVLYKTNEYWAYPQGYGDCEDFVLAKRQALMARSWPASALLITVVREANGDGHAVLMVRTDRGDLVLDNQEGLIKVWNETPYRFLKRQSQANAGEWVDILDSREPVIASR